jgi:polar amino acid transport system permease protein
MTGFWQPHRLVLALIGLAAVLSAAVFLQWDWLANPKYLGGPLFGAEACGGWPVCWKAGMIEKGIWLTVWMTVVTMGLGMALAIPIGYAQAMGPWYLALPARVFCTVIRGTPLLMQIWLLYYGLGSLFPGTWIQKSALWPVLREAWPYALLALSLSVAGYEGEVMRGAFRSVPHGQLEAARAMGMPPFTLFRRIWLPQALHRVLPTIGGETVLQLKSTPLISTITLIEIYNVAGKVRADTFIIYEPLLLLAVCYMALTGLIVLLFKWFEAQFPSRTA